MMKKMLPVALVVLFAGAGSAFAQGLPAGSEPPVYGSQAFPNQPYHTGTVFQEIVEHLNAWQARSDQGASPKQGE